MLLRCKKTTSDEIVMDMHESNKGVCIRTFLLATDRYMSLAEEKQRGNVPKNGDNGWELYNKDKIH